MEFGFERIWSCLKIFSLESLASNKFKNNNEGDKPKKKVDLANLNIDHLSSSAVYAQDNGDIESNPWEHMASKTFTQCDVITNDIK